MMAEKIMAGDVVTLKKAHPCGSASWLVTRTGMDFGLKCQGCGHFVMLPRPKLMKQLKSVTHNNSGEKEE